MRVTRRPTRRPTAPIRTAAAIAVALVLGITLASPAGSTPTSEPAPAVRSLPVQEDPAFRAATTKAPARRACRAPQCWIAGTRNPSTGYAFMNWNLSTKGAAVRAAMKQCRKKTRDRFDSSCTRSGTQRHGCLAIVYLTRNDTYRGARSAGVEYRRKLSVRETKLKAIRRAKAKFESAPGVRKVWSAHCTAR